MEKKRQARFQRTKAFAYVKLSRKNKVRYKRPTGRHNKSRQKWRSRPPMVEIGYKNQKSTSGLVNGKKPVNVYNLQDLKNIGKDSIAIFGKVGKKLKIEMAKQALSEKIEVFNLNINKFLKQNEKAKNKPEAKTEKKEDANKQK